MGYYTEVSLRARLKDPKAFDDLIAAIRRNEGVAPFACSSYGTDPVFLDERAGFVFTEGHCSGVDEAAFRVIDGWFVFHTNLKNYTETYEKFFAWLAPYLDLSTLNGTYAPEDYYVPAPLIAVEGKIVIDFTKVTGDEEY